MDTGYPVFIPDISARKTDRNVEKPQPQVSDAHSATGNDEERAKEGAAK